MKIKDIIEREEANKDGILLFKEGYFYRGYNHSAILFVEYIKPIKIINKYFKIIKSEVIYCGFPLSSVKDIEKISKEKGFDILIKDDDIRINGIVSDKIDFDEWIQSFKKKNSEERQLTVHEIQNEYQQQKASSLNLLYQKIIQFPLENKTPMQTMQFVQELKQLALNDKSQTNGNLRSSTSLQNKL